MSKFIIPKQNWKSIPVESAEFILDNGKDYLDYTLSESEKITNRAYSLIILLSTILSALVAYTFTKLANNEMSKVTEMNFYLSIVISTLIVCLLTLVFPRTIMRRGRLPSNLAQEKFLINSKLTKEEIYLAFVIREIEDTQDKIDFNLSKNKSRRDKLKLTMLFIAFLLPIYLIIAFFVFN